MNKIALSLLVLVVAGTIHCGRSDDSSSAPDSDAVILSGMRVLITTKSSAGTYDRAADDWFHVSATRSDMTMAMFTVGRKKDGKPDIAAGRPMSETQTDLPDRSAGEFEKVRLSRDSDGVVYLEMRMRSTVDLPGELNAETRDEVEFVQGDWFEYEAGNKVVFRLSEEGMKTSAASMKKVLEDQFTPMLRGVLLQQLKQQRKEENWKISEADLGRVLYVKTSVEISDDYPNTLHTAKGGRISFDEDRPFDADITVWVGLTDKNLRK